MLTVLQSSVLSNVDPRARIVAAVALSVAVVTASRITSVGLALSVSAAAAAVSGLPLKTTVKRLLPLNIVILLLAVLLPLTTPGTVVGALGPLTFSREGLRLAAVIALKGNAVLLMLIALLGTIEPIVLGHALNHLRVPDKLTQLLLFTVRYLDVLHREYVRLRTTMKARGFRPGIDLHTYRSLGYLVGMLLVRSFDRAERIVAAMKCRGFQGRFFLLDHFAFGPRDIAFSMATGALLLTLLSMEWNHDIANSL